jgi:hypothetical protein
MRLRWILARIVSLGLPTLWIYNWFHGPVMDYDKTYLKMVMRRRLNERN